MPGTSGQVWLSNQVYFENILVCKVPLMPYVLGVVTIFLSSKDYFSTVKNESF